MAELDTRSRRIRILRDEVSRKIAAGEVIDRPFSIVRELLDNAIDAGATSIDVYLEGGGLGRVRVVDDGAGMGADDLSLCWRPHATSKIESEDDLLRVSSLGFRGEALSSVAVCSRLVIVSARAADEPAHRLEVRGGREQALEECQGRVGTSVDVSELFFNYPARKKFLKSVSAESGLCRTIFVDRAIAHPGISFRLFMENEMKLALPRSSAVERVAAAYRQLLDRRLLREATEEGEGFTVHVIAGSPELRRRDRKLLQGFVNRRRVTEFALLQAVEFGFSGFMPGGWYPVGFVFVDIDPSLVDFNIHPAKKEVRFRTLPDVHRTIVAAVRATLAASERPVTLVEAKPAPWLMTGADASAGPSAGAGPHAAGVHAGGRRGFTLPVLPGDAPLPISGDTGVRFLGQVFGVFLIFELPGRLLMLDQHAAHERLIFERLSAQTPPLQEMLFPLAFDVSDGEETILLVAQQGLRETGIELRRAGTRAFEVTALSPDFKSLPEERLIELVRGISGTEWRYGFLAAAACRMAIKEGDRVDPVTAMELCNGARALAVPRCPHGRPIWHELTRESLLRLVDRPVP
jgi:DNA mismatch repair protein MutL